VGLARDTGSLESGPEFGFSLKFGFPAGSVGLAAGRVGVAEFGWIDLWFVLIVGA
jgi:hypothetical protein